MKHARQQHTPILQVGDIVVLVGLSQRPELNGRSGFLQDHIAEKGRWRVRLTPSDKAAILPKDIINGESLSIHPKNMILRFKFQHVLQKAASGDKSIRYHVAVLYLKLVGSAAKNPLPVSGEQVVEWLRSTAKRGHVPSMIVLASDDAACSPLANFVSELERKQLLKKAADRGNLWDLLDAIASPTLTTWTLAEYRQIKIATFCNANLWNEAEQAVWDQANDSQLPHEEKVLAYQWLDYIRLGRNTPLENGWKVLIRVARCHINPSNVRALAFRVPKDFEDTLLESVSSFLSAITFEAWSTLELPDPPCATSPETVSGLIIAGSKALELKMFLQVALGCWIRSPLFDFCIRSTSIPYGFNAQRFVADVDMGHHSELEREILHQHKKKQLQASRVQQLRSDMAAHLLEERTSLLSVRLQKAIAQPDLEELVSVISAAEALLDQNGTSIEIGDLLVQAREKLSMERARLLYQPARKNKTVHAPLIADLAKRTEQVDRTSMKDTLQTAADVQKCTQPCKVVEIELDDEDDAILVGDDGLMLAVHGVLPAEDWLEALKNTFLHVAQSSTAVRRSFSAPLRSTPDWPVPPEGSSTVRARYFSEGSKGHADGKCKPCRWEQRRPGACRRGASCLFCHQAHRRSRGRSSAAHASSSHEF